VVAVERGIGAVLLVLLRLKRLQALLDLLRGAKIHGGLNNCESEWSCHRASDLSLEDFGQGPLNVNGLQSGHVPRPNAQPAHHEIRAYRQLDASLPPKPLHPNPDAIPQLL